MREISALQKFISIVVHLQKSQFILEDVPNNHLMHPYEKHYG